MHQESLSLLLTLIEKKQALLSQVFYRWGKGSALFIIRICFKQISVYNTLGRRKDQINGRTTCYMCEQANTTPEHVPPKCIFPEVKDLGIDYRKSLITVPSCDAHNLRKSKDDEYLMFVLTCSITNNEAAMKQIETKILRAWRRNSRLKELLLRINRPIIAKGKSTLAFKVDIGRVNRSLDWIARGLYYNQYEKKWSAKLRIESPAMLFLEGKDALKSNKILNHMGVAVNHALSDLPKIGENPDIFWYQMLHNSPGELLINMMFFGGLQVFAFNKSGMA